MTVGRENVYTVQVIKLVIYIELYHISGVRTHIQKVKPKMAEFEEL